MAIIVKLTSKTFKCVENQRAFQVHKKRPDSAIRVSEIYKDDLLLACRTLNESELKIYLYLISNQDNYIGGLSRVNIMNETGISESSYKRAIKGLMDKHYLVYNEEIAEDSQGMRLPLYHFYAHPEWVQFGLTC